MKQKPEEITELDSYEPDYDHLCQNCGETPVVTGVKDGKVIYKSRLCGPCCFGEFSCSDPEEWNK